MFNLLVTVRSRAFQCVSRAVLVTRKQLSDAPYKGGSRRPPILRSKSKTSTNRGSKAVSAVPPPTLSIAESWVEVVDKPSGQIYYWNTITNETTPLGAEKPVGETALANGAAPAGGGGVMGGLGRVVAEGFAFGVGSSVAHGLVGSMFGGHSDNRGGGGDAGAVGGDDDGFDL
jgi:hypothetical protein